MQADKSMKLMVVMLEDLIQHSIPRLLSIQKKMEAGNAVLDSDLDFISDTLQTISKCYSDYKDDKDCVHIFFGVTSLLNEVVQKAFENENSELRIAV